MSVEASSKKYLHDEASKRKSGSSSKPEHGEGEHDCRKQQGDKKKQVRSRTRECQMCSNQHQIDPGSFLDDLKYKAALISWLKAYVEDDQRAHREC